MKSLRHLRLPENPVNFLKIILSDDTRSIGIRLPKKFTEKHGKDLLESERVILKVPNGDIWQVDLQEKSRGEIWLKDGWWEFAERYGLRYGHLLMFKYEGFAIFGVIIFNASGSEMVCTRESPQQVKRTGLNLKTVKSEEETCSSSSTSEDERPGFKINDGAECSRKRQKKKRL